jgi:Flp pilus assembly protein TadB
VSTSKRRLRWGSVPEAPPPRHPIRDTLLVYAGLAVVVVLVAWVTGGSLPRAIIVAVVFYVLASLWSVWRLRGRQRARAARRGSEAGGAGK